MAERRASGEQTDVCNPKAVEDDAHWVTAQSCLESSRIICSIHWIYTIEASFKLKIQLKFQCQIFTVSDDGREAGGGDPVAAQIQLETEAVLEKSEA